MKIIRNKISFLFFHYHNWSRTCSWIVKLANCLIIAFLIFNPYLLISQNNLDQLQYNYYSSTNRLEYLIDAVGSSTSTVDIDNQSSTNYAYDAVGQLTQDISEGILDIDWTVSGKVRKVSIDDDGNSVADRTLEFKYDALGNRVKKIETTISTSAIQTTVYIRNATGDLISIYESDGTITERIEVNISGVGTDKTDEASALSEIKTRSLGNKNYELKDHLGNIRVVVNDAKEPVYPTNPLIFQSSILNSTDYCSYGMQMSDRSLSASEAYSYGFNGKEKDDELKGSGNSYDFGARLYDPRVARWMNTDPLENKYPTYSPFVAMNNNPINFNDPNGMEAWPVKRDWNESDVEMYGEFVLKAVATYQKNGQKFDCADLQTTLLVMYAFQNGLPVSFHTDVESSSKGAVLSSTDDLSKYKIKYDPKNPDQAAFAFLSLVRMQTTATSIKQDMSPIFSDPDAVTTEEFFSKVRIGDIQNKLYHINTYSGQFEEKENGTYRLIFLEGNYGDETNEAGVNLGVVPKRQYYNLYPEGKAGLGMVFTEDMDRWNVLNFSNNTSSKQNHAQSAPDDNQSSNSE